MSKVALIFGISGQDGAYLAKLLLSKGYIVHGTSRDAEMAEFSLLKLLAIKEEITFHSVALNDFRSILKIFEKVVPDEVYNLAGQSSVGLSFEQPLETLESIANSNINILEAMRMYSSNSLLAFSSTNKVYGDLDWIRIVEEDLRYSLRDFPKGLDENIPLDFSTPYGCSKGSADQYVKEWSRVYGLKTVIFRHSSIYGGRQYASVDQGWIGWFCKKVLEQDLQFKNKEKIVPFTISGSGKQVRDVLHSEDLVDLYHSAYNHREKLFGETFNIGGGVENSLSILELFEVLKKFLDLSKLEYLNIERRTSDQDCFIANISKAENILNWSPKVSLRKNDLLV